MPRRRAGPVGDPASADATAEVALDEFSVTPESPNVAAGTITFDATNEGEEPDELVVVRADDAESLPVAEGQVQEDELPAGAFIEEIEAFPAGEKCDGTLELAAGDHVLFCNVVEEEEGGEIESHFEMGMHTEFTVTG
jgi:hypothetical protein